MNILITGGKGFLAGRVYEFFKKKNLKVTLSSRIKSKNFAYINWNSDKILNKLCKDKDVIINCAGLDSHGCKLKKKAIKVNSIYPLKLLKAAKKNNVKLFIFLSTFHVYAMKSGQIFENAKLNRKSNYTLSKIKGETNVLKENSKTTKVLVLRICNLFGYPYFKNKNCWRLLINSAIKDLIEKKRFKIKSKENSYRNYSSVQSFNEFIFNIIMQFNNLKTFPKIMNYCSEKNISIIEICNILKRKIGNKRKLSFKYSNLKKVKKTIFSSKYQKHFKKLKDKYFYLELKKLINYTKKSYNER